MARESITKALFDAGVTYDVVEQAFVGYCYGDSTCGQRALYQVGMTQIPILNVNNNCSTGSSALFMARQAVAGGISECTIALGFEKMAPGSLGSIFEDRSNPMEKFMEVMNDARGFGAGPPAAQLFGNAGVEHMEKYGTTERHFAKIGHKNHKHRFTFCFPTFFFSLCVCFLLLCYSHKSLTPHFLFSFFLSFFFSSSLFVNDPASSTLTVSSRRSTHLTKCRMVARSSST